MACCQHTRGSGQHGSSSRHCRHVSPRKILSSCGGIEGPVSQRFTHVQHRIVNSDPHAVHRCPGTSVPKQLALRRSLALSRRVVSLNGSKDPCRACRTGGQSSVSLHAVGSVLRSLWLSPRRQAARLEKCLPKAPGSAGFPAAAGSHWSRGISPGRVPRSGGGGAGSNPSPRGMVTAPVLSTYSLQALCTSPI